MPRQEYMLEIDLKHYPTPVDARTSYKQSTFPHPLVTIDWDIHGDPVKILAVGKAVFAVADAISKGGDDNEIIRRLVERLREKREIDG